MGDGFFEPGVQDNQSLVVQWQSKDSGLGVVPEQSLAKPVTFEKILDFLCAHEVYALAKSISPEALTTAQEHQVQSFLDDTDVKIAMGLCELEQLQSFISVFDINRQRALLFDFGHYDAAIFHGGEALVVLWQLQALFIGLRIIPTPFIMSSNITSRECAT